MGLFKKEKNFEDFVNYYIKPKNENKITKDVLNEFYALSEKEYSRIDLFLAFVSNICNLIIFSENTEKINIAFLNMLKKNDNNFESLKVYLGHVGPHLSQDEYYMILVELVYNRTTESSFEIITDNFNILTEQRKTDILGMLMSNLFNHYHSSISNFLLKNFDPENERFIRFVDHCFVHYPIDFFISDVGALKKHLKDKRVKNIVIKNTFDSPKKVNLLISNFSDYLDDSDYVFLINMLFYCKQSSEELLDIIRLIYRKNYTQHVEDEIVKNLLSIEEDNEFLDILAIVGPHLSKDNYKKFEKKSNNLENIDSIYKYCIYTPNFSNEALIDKIIEEKNPEYLYNISVFLDNKIKSGKICDENELNIIKEKMVKLINELLDSNNEYYIIMYALNIDENILVEYYKDYKKVTSILLHIQLNGLSEDSINKFNNSKNLKLGKLDNSNKE